MAPEPSKLYLSLTLLCAAAVVILPAAAQDTAVEEPAVEVLDSGLRILANGEVFEYTKLRSGAKDVMVYAAPGLELDADELAAYEAAHPPPIVSPALVERAALAGGEELELAVFLRARPGTALARQARRAPADELDAMTAEVLRIHRTLRPTTSLSPAEEILLRDAMDPDESLLPDAQLQYLRDLATDIDREREARRAELHGRIRAAVAADQRSMAEQIATLGGRVIATVPSQNALTVRLPAWQLPELVRIPLVARVFELTPVVPELDQQSISLGLYWSFWPNGITGGTCEVGLLDSGIQHDHPALRALPLRSLIGAADPVGHGTACAGVLASSDLRFRGTAYGLNQLLMGSYGAGQVMAHADWMVSNPGQGAEAINLSAGYGMANDVDYNAFDQFWDGLVDDHSVLVATSAGNNGGTATTLTHPASAYNVIAVAAMDDNNTTGRDDDLIAASSSRGPTLGGRKKPDLCAPGARTLTACHQWSTWPDFIEHSGTSLAAAHVTGGGVLLADLRLLDRPMVDKAVLINTADAWDDQGAILGSHWNKTYGWGYLDLWEAWFNGLDFFARSVNEIYPEYHLFYGYMRAHEKSTLVWNRHVAYRGSSYPIAVESLSDLDLEIYDEATGLFVGGSYSAVDNVEQVDTDRDRQVVLKVSLFGKIDPDVVSEPFALATEENFQWSRPPNLLVSNPYIGPISPNQAFLLPLRATNMGSVYAHDNVFEMVLPSGFSLLTGFNPWSVAPIPGDSSLNFIWTVRPPCATGTYHAVSSFRSDSYGEKSFGSLGVDLEVATTALPEGASVTSRFMPQTYHFPVATDRWAAIGLIPGADGQDLDAAGERCVLSPYATSGLVGSGRDFTLTNGHLAAGQHYALVRSPWDQVSRTTSYRLEHAAAADHAVDTALITPLGPAKVLKVFESSLVAGKTYDAIVNVLGGTVDVGLFVFRGDRANAHRSSADFTAVAAPPGASEAVRFIAPVSGVYAFVVVNENAGESAIEFRLKGDLLFRDGFEAGDTDAWS